MTLELGYGSRIQSAVVDLANGNACFGSTYLLTKVRLRDFSIRRTLSLPGGEYGNWAVFDPIEGYAYFCGGRKLLKVNVGKGDDVPARVGALTLNNNENIGPPSNQNENINFLPITIDPPAGYLYLCATNMAGKVIKVALSHKNAVHANRFIMAELGTLNDVRFFSHAAQGNLRLAIYDDASTKTLLWQSASTSNTAANAWLNIPAESGTPRSLVLQPGRYWLAWQTDVTTTVASYTAGAANCGFIMDQPFGNFPAAIANDSVTSTSDLWSEYLTYYDPANSGQVEVKVRPDAAFWEAIDHDGVNYPGDGNRMINHVSSGRVAMHWNPLAGYDVPSDDTTKTLAPGGSISFLGLYLPKDDPVQRKTVNIIRYLLDLDNSPAGLDINTDGLTNIADAISSVNSMPPEAPLIPLPLDGAINVSIKTNLYWAQCNYAQTYDIYLWLATLGNRPAQATQPGLISAFFNPAGELLHGTEYRWQVIARNANGSTAGPVWGFKTQ